MQQVVAFDRDARGSIVTLGQITRTGDGFEWITDAAAGSPGSVRVQVGDIQPCCGTPKNWAQRQWRTYGWDGRRFRQTDGPTSFPKSSVPPASLTITATDLVYGPPDETGRRHGSMTVTITNTGGSTVDHPMVTFARSDRDDAEHTRWLQCPTLVAKPDSYRCLAEPLAPGKPRTLTFEFSTAVDAAPVEATVRVDPADAEGSALPNGGDQTTYLIKRST